MQFCLYKFLVLAVKMKGNMRKRASPTNVRDKIKLDGKKERCWKKLI